MNPTCMRCAFCDATFRSSDVLPEFPVAKTLAFDPTDPNRARLWSVCERCRQWNLAPLDAADRRLAIARLEQLFLATASRRVYEDVGVAKLPKGRSLIRVGAGGWWSFAAWRYGKRLVRRRIAWLAMLGAVVLVPEPVSTALAALAIVMLLPLLMYGWWLERVCPVRLDDGSVAWITARLEKRARLRLRTGSPDWELLVHHTRGISILSGTAALPVLAMLLARRNHKGATAAEVADAISMIERGGGSRDVFVLLKPTLQQVDANGVLLEWIPTTLRLALEMAAHEETERRALLGELAALKLEKREAEQHARIVEEELA